MCDSLATEFKTNICFLYCGIQICISCASWLATKCPSVELWFWVFITCERKSKLLPDAGLLASQTPQGPWSPGWQLLVFQVLKFSLGLKPQDRPVMSTICEMLFLWVLLEDPISANWLDTGSPQSNFEILSPCSVLALISPFCVAHVFGCFQAKTTTIL